MIIGLCAWSFTAAHARAARSPDPMTPAGLAELASAEGLAAIELAASSIARLSQEERERFAGDASRDSLQLVLDVGGSSDPNGIGEAASVALETAAKTGAKLVRTTISQCLEGDRRNYGWQGWKDHLSELVLPLRRAADVAEQLGVEFGVENHQDICSVELVWLCEKVASPSFGVVMDCGNALAVGEDPVSFAERVMPYLKHVHLKDYVIHPTESGWRFVRCPVGAGVVDFPTLIDRFAAGAPGVIGCIELGASSARHVRLLEEDWWATFDSRPWPEPIAAIRALHRGERPSGLDWRTPHERGSDASTIVDYELDQYRSSVGYLREVLE